MEEAREFAVVSTSAAQLYSILHAGELARDNTKLGVAIAQKIGAESSNPSIAMKYLRNLVLNVNADLGVSFDGPLLAHLQRSMSPFQRLLSFAVYDQKCRDLSANGNMLDSAIVEGILGVDAALQGKCERPVLNITDTVLESISSLRTDLESVELPENIHRILSSRIDQLEKAIRHFNLYGVAGMNEAMEALLGAIELYVPQKKKLKPAYGKLRGAVFSTLLVLTGAVATTNNTVKDGVELIENVMDGARMIEDLREVVAKSDKDEEE